MSWVTSVYSHSLEAVGLQRSAGSDVQLVSRNKSTSLNKNNNKKLFYCSEKWATNEQRVAFRTWRFLTRTRVSEWSTGCVFLNPAVVVGKPANTSRQSAWPPNRKYIQFSSESSKRHEGQLFLFIEKIYFIHFILTHCSCWLRLSRNTLQSIKAF